MSKMNETLEPATNHFQSSVHIRRRAEISEIEGLGITYTLPLLHTLGEAVVEVRIHPRDLSEASFMHTEKGRLPAAATFQGFGVVGTDESKEAIRIARSGESHNV